METKVCTLCKEEKPIEEFPPRSGKEPGVRCYCKKCKNAQNQAYKEQHKEKKRISDALYREKNREVLRERQRLWREQHPEADKKIHSKWKSENKEKVNAATNRYRSRMKENGGKFTRREFESVKKKQNYTCLLCGRQEPDISLTVDHIVPVSKGGSNLIENIQALCISCNCRKHTNLHCPFETL